MKKLLLVAVLMALTGCNQKAAPVAEPVAQAVIVPEVPMIDHYYAMKDGFAYGYQRQLAADDINAGTASIPLIMASYAGEKNGKHQVFSNLDGAYFVVECEAKCDYLKLMSFNNISGKFISRELIKAEAGVVATNMIVDAINGKLEQFEPEKNGKKYHVWFDQEKGFTSTPLDK